MTIKRSKFNVRTDKIGKLERTADGILFDSKDECKRYHELKILERAGHISNLEVHPTYPIVWPGKNIKICNVELDFRYQLMEHTDKKYPNLPWRWKIVIEDVKGKEIPMSKLKRKLVEAAYGITVKLITKPKKVKRNGPNKTRAVSK